MLYIYVLWNYHFSLTLRFRSTFEATPFLLTKFVQYYRFVGCQFPSHIKSFLVVIYIACKMSYLTALNISQRSLRLERHAGVWVVFKGLLEGEEKNEQLSDKLRKWLSCWHFQKQFLLRIHVWSALMFNFVAVQRSGISR